jgi:hypothetical protein
MHTWTLKRNSKMIKFYSWLYLEETTKEHSLSKLTFCRLFWGIVCSPFSLFFVLFITPMAAAIGYISDKVRHHQRTRKPTTKNAANAVPEKTAHFFDKVAAWFQAHAWVSKVFSGFVWGWFIGIVVGICVFAGTEVNTHWLGFLLGLKWAGIGLGGLLTIVLLGVVLAGILWALSKTIWPPIEDVLEAVGKWAWRSILCRIGHGIRGVFWFFVAGHHAVKYRTCPMIKIED